jgi:antitoxin CptB
LETRRKRLLYRSWHRGTRESDLILGRFAAAHLDGFDEAQLDRYEALLECADADLYDWVADRASPPAIFDHDVMRLLRTFTRAPPPVRPDSAGPRPVPCRARSGEDRGGGTA